MVACYLPFDGEVDIRRMLKGRHAGGKSYCLPAVSRSHDREMRFLKYRPGEYLVRNRFGIGEPLTLSSAIVPSSAIDVAIVPVVGFDAAGSRIGMGAGYYDRFFGRGNHAPRRHAQLIGVAFEIQRLDRIERREWDVPLDVVVTEKSTYLAGV